MGVRTASTMTASFMASPDLPLYVIKSSAAGLAEKTGDDELFQQRRRAIAVVAGFALQSFEHREDFVQTDLIGPPERTLRIVDAEAHGDVDLFGRGDTFFQAPRRFIDDQTQNARKGKPGRIFHPNGFFAERCKQLLGLFEC